MMTTQYMGFPKDHDSNSGIEHAMRLPPLSIFSIVLSLFVNTSKFKKQHL